MTNVSKLSVSLRRKTDDLPHSVAPSYWIKKDVSPLFRSQKTAKLSETPQSRQTSVRVVSTGCSFCSVFWLLGGTTETTEAMVRASCSIKDNTLFNNLKT